jgi:transcriptional regulator with XRE-family HTH domain
MARARNAELTARVRAAWAFSGLSQKQLAAKTGINEGTLRGYLRKAKPNIPGSDEAGLIAKACGVPPSFMEEGFSEQEPGDDARLVALEDQMGAVAVLLPLLVERLGAELPPAAAEALERVLGRKA